jgi:hypothetical protein
MATALCGWGKSIALRNLLRLPDSPAWLDSRRYRKICTELVAPRWRLRFLVGVDQLLREIFPDCQTIRPSWTVAATGISDCETIRPRWAVAATGLTG